MTKIKARNVQRSCAASQRERHLSRRKPFRLLVQCLDYYLLQFCKILAALTKQICTMSFSNAAAFRLNCGFLRSNFISFQKAELPPLNFNTSLCPILSDSLLHFPYICTRVSSDLTSSFLTSCDQFCHRSVVSLSTLNNYVGFLTAAQRFSPNFCGRVSQGQMPLSCNKSAAFSHPSSLPASCPVAFTYPNSERFVMPHAVISQMLGTGIHSTGAVSSPQKCRHVVRRVAIFTQELYMISKMACGFHFCDQQQYFTVV
ncbi:hypothetical protein T4D_10450 [Trichinella pseudospiralis]|uniref:Uncharacterized protein n=1 Tax=Trichinella pseudospiralis TaxID=6337 RepID=A0A0V1F7N7_TRIPS|nr:hypothetical protein T4D_10450 [Trichinella pseudospiralis]